MYNQKTEFLLLSDGRSLAFNEYGDSRGYPIFYFHGSPGSRLEGIYCHKPGIEHGLRVIAPDRPGMGKSDYQQKRTWLDWPNDVLELANYLNIHKFGVMGASGGSPPVLVCTHEIPHLLEIAIVLGGWAPDTEGKLYHHLSRIERYYGKFIKFPRIFRFFYSFIGLFAKHQSDERLMRNFQSSMCQTDKKIIEEQKEITSFLANDIRESFRQGAKGPSHDAILQYRDWGFNLEEISFPVQIHHGTDDKMAPYAFGEFIHQKIHESTFTAYPGEGHFSLLNMISVVLNKIDKNLFK